jgi:5-formyltetrahydrofolate cyclo-ligase
MAPTYLCRFPGSHSYGRRGSALKIMSSSVTAPAHVEEAKASLRRDALAHRDALLGDTRQAAADSIATRKFPLAITPTTVISGFMPLKSEINPLPLMKVLAEAGATLALPVVTGRGKPLIMRAWRWGEPLNEGVWGIREPKPEAREVEPDILLVPLLAFDRAGNRIGYGAGYYDMTIARLRARKPVTAIGIAFAIQEVPAVPATERDERLDLVLTENEVIEIKSPASAP